MKNSCLFLTLLIVLSAPLHTNAFGHINSPQPPEDSLVFHDGHSFPVIGKLHDEKNYHRFPYADSGSLRKPVWNLSLHSAGISIRFRTNATQIAVRWTPLNDAGMPHMAATGVKGVDLYAYEKDHWQYAGTGLPREKTTQALLLKNGDGVEREYLLNLPLYDGIESLFIGVNAGAVISAPKDPKLLSNKPVVYYGSSIAQGGCASRPGLAFTNILSRKLDRSFINLGFSGNGTFDSSVGDGMARVNAALYVIDCNPNTKAELVYEGAVNLVRLLKAKQPGIPILLVEGSHYDSDFFTAAKNQLNDKKRAELRRAFETLKRSGVKGLYYKKGDNLTGKDHEGTVDGDHPNDLGMMRMADALAPAIRSAIRKGE
ncbi:MAG TPA: SGNH/GDSL hydrolase family protein [Flavitalea sp.]|nr:SGNH/GDSL hydrolase family protein [Flavitalea sp.]